jgi:hypothetical protein
VRSGIRFLNVENVSPAEIHRQIVEMCGEGVMNKVNVHKWCRLFNGGRTDVHNEARTGCPSVITEDLKDRFDPHICGNRGFTIDELDEVQICFMICSL